MNNETGVLGEKTSFNVFTRVFHPSSAGGGVRAVGKIRIVSFFPEGFMFLGACS